MELVLAYSTILSVLVCVAEEAAVDILCMASQIVPYLLPIAVI